MGIKLENYEMRDIEKFIFVYLFQLICRPSVTYGIQSVFNKLCKPSIEVKFLVIVLSEFFRYSSLISITTKSEFVLMKKEKIAEAAIKVNRRSGSSRPKRFFSFVNKN